MALPATHFRFALDAARHFDISDRHAYLSGTLYPDSRWLTGVARTATHGEQCLAIDFANSDFELGWYVHCRCDNIQIRLVSARWPRLTTLDNQTRWIQTSVIKMIQDQQDIRRINMNDCLEALDVIETPNGEQAKKVRRYYHNVRDVYAGDGVPDIEDYRKLWLAVGVETAIVSEMMEQLRRERLESTVRTLAASLFDEMVAEFDDSMRPVRPLHFNTRKER
jgi:hypothetical protein